jgi:hypothetical protein
MGGWPVPAGDASGGSSSTAPSSMPLRLYRIRFSAPFDPRIDGLDAPRGSIAQCDDIGALWFEKVGAQLTDWVIGGRGKTCLLAMLETEAEWIALCRGIARDAEYVCTPYAILQGEAPSETYPKGRMVNLVADLAHLTSQGGGSYARTMKGPFGPERGAYQATQRQGDLQYMASEDPDEYPFGGHPVGQNSFSILGAMSATRGGGGGIAAGKYQQNNLDQSLDTGLGPAISTNDDRGFGYLLQGAVNRMNTNFEIVGGGPNYQTDIDPNSLRWNYADGRVRGLAWGYNERKLTATSVSAAANTYTIQAHGLSDDDVIQTQNTGGAVPAELPIETNYFAIVIDEDTIQFSATQGGSAINFSAGSGTQHVIAGAGFLRISDSEVYQTGYPGDFSTTDSVFGLFADPSGIPGGNRSTCGDLQWPALVVVLDDESAKNLNAIREDMVAFFEEQMAYAQQPFEAVGKFDGAKAVDVTRALDSAFVVDFYGRWSYVEYSLSENLTGASGGQIELMVGPTNPPTNRVAFVGFAGADVSEQQILAGWVPPGSYVMIKTTTGYGTVSPVYVDGQETTFQR